MSEFNNLISMLNDKNDIILSQQAKIDGLKKQLTRLGYTDNGAKLMKPPLGKTPDFGLVSIQRDKIDELQARIDEALNMLCKLQHSSSERIYNDVGNILKGK